MVEVNIYECIIKKRSLFGILLKIRFIFCNYLFLNFLTQTFLYIINSSKKTHEVGLFDNFKKETNSYSALVYMVRIPGFHPGGPGSIPGCGIFFILLFINY